MREILFRGKRTDNGEWIYGMMHKSRPDIGTYDYITEEGRWFENGIGMLLFHKEKVVPETIGQYTGIKDKNGKKIFEGDIVKYAIYPEDNFEIHQVIFEHGVFGADGNSGCALCVAAMDGVGEYKLEVIGNIHDNPELLKGGTDK